MDACSPCWKGSSCLGSADFNYYFKQSSLVSTLGGIMSGTDIFLDDATVAR
jgi:hypothetical protein